jgi:hypothetical protein
MVYDRAQSMCSADDATPFTCTLTSAEKALFEIGQQDSAQFEQWKNPRPGDAGGRISRSRLLPRSQKRLRQETLPWDT